MAYVPINVTAYTAAYSGAISGMATSGWLVDSVSADYTPVTEIAGAFAQAFDAVWDDANPLNNLEIQAISQITSENFGHRSPGPQSAALFFDPGNWTQTAAACAALVLQSDAYFAGQGINPGTPGGGGSDVAPFKGMFYVNPTFAGTQLGSQSNPFVTVAAAFAAAVALGLTEGIIYTTDITENVVFPLAGNWELAGIHDLYYPSYVTINGTVDLSCNANRNISLTDLQINGLVSGTAPVGMGAIVRVTGCALEAGLNVDGAGNRPWYIIFVGNAPNGGAGGFGGYVEGGLLSVKGRLFASDYSFFSNIAVFSGLDAVISMQNCNVSGMAITATAGSAGANCAMIFADTNINATTLTFAGPGLNVLSVDAASARNGFQSGYTAVGAFATTLANAKRTALVNNVAATALGFKSPNAQMRVNGTMTLVTPGTAGNAVLNISYTDSLGVARTKPITTPLNIAGVAGDEVQGTLVFAQNGTAQFNYSVTGIVTPGPLSYNLCVSIEPAS